MSDIFEKYDLVDVDESFPIPALPDAGLVLLVGSSGSGKSTILREWFNEKSIEFDSRPIYQNFSSEQEAEKLLVACGLRSIPSWKREYSCLSNGEKHRAFCAKSLDVGSDYIDEFSSVVDRNTAKSLSFAIQKHFRRSKMQRLVIATCHRDIVEWLNPDFVYDTDLKSWHQPETRGCLRRPAIDIFIRNVDGREFWPVFQKHHYLSRGFNKSSKSFVAYWEENLVAFCSIISFPNGNIKSAWREHRTVVVPEFQGLGIGSAVSDQIGEMVISSGGRYFSKTSHPAFGEYREKSEKWKPTSKNKKARLDYISKHKTKEDGHKMKHRGRVCYSHEYVGL